MYRSLHADLYLLLIALIWGITFPLITEAIKYMSPFLFVTLYFATGGFFLFYCCLKNIKETDRTVLWAGLVLGALNAAVFILQTTGMKYVDTDTAAFIASTGVIFVPFLSPFFQLAKVKTIEIYGCFICLFGLYVLIGGDFHYINIWELLILLSSICWAASICYVQKITPYIKSFKLLSLYQVIFVLPFSIPFSIMDYKVSSWSPILIFTILFTGILATAITFLIQMRYQKETTATHAVIIFTLEPVLASFISIYINRGPLTSRIIYGGGIILMSILLVELLSNFSIRNNKPKAITCE